MQHARAAMGTRGDWNPTARPGDLTGQRVKAQASIKEDRDIALAAMRNALTSDPVEVVSIPGGRSFLVPTELVKFLLDEGMRRD